MNSQPNIGRVGLVVFLIGVAIIAVNAYMQETNGWSFFPLGAIGGALVGLGFWYWRIAPSKR